MAPSDAPRSDAKDTLGRLIHRQATIRCPICGDTIGAGRGKAAMVSHLMGKGHAVSQADANVLLEALFGAIDAMRRVRAMRQASRALDDLAGSVGLENVEAFQRACWEVLAGVEEGTSRPME